MLKIKVKEGRTNTPVTEYESAHKINRNLTPIQEYKIGSDRSNSYSISLYLGSWSECGTPKGMKGITINGEASSILFYIPGRMHFFSSFFSIREHNSSALVKQQYCIIKINILIVILV